MLQLATINDIPELLPLMNEFYKLSKYSTKEFNYNKTELSLIKLLNEPELGIVIIDRDESINGFIIGYISDLPIVDSKVTIEVAWYVSPKAKKIGLKLFNAFEYWSQYVVKADANHMAQLEGSTPVSNLYSRRGYKKQEEVWVKEWQ